MKTMPSDLALTRNFETLLPILEATGPASLQERRIQSMAAFSAAGIPTTKHEEFRYVPLQKLAEGAFGPAYGANVDASDLKGTLLAGLPAVTLTFVNGEYAPELSNLSGLPEGVWVRPLSEAFDDPDCAWQEVLGQVANFDNKLGSSNDDRFVHLNSAFLTDGAYISVSSGVKVEIPVHVRYVFTANHGTFAAYPRTGVVLGDDASLDLVESFIGLPGEAYFSNAVFEARVGSRSRLHHVIVQANADQAIHLGAGFVEQDEHSTYDSCALSLGGEIGRHEVNVFLKGEETETWLNGVYVGSSTQIRANHTRIDHAQPNCRSFEIYKGILSDRSSGVFNGKIFVYEDAQKTDAKQTNQALLLSKEATVNTKPQLEIFADDVKCTHGATVGQIRKDSLFYLRARGIPEAQARKLLIYAFAAEALDKITIEPVREELEQSIFERFAGGI